MPSLAACRAAIAAAHTAPDASLLAPLIATHAPAPEERGAALGSAVALVRAIRSDARPGMMEVFLAEYGLSTDEGVALMCLAEALLRVPDAATIDDLIEDKIAPSDWGRHLGQSSSTLVNASTWALMLTGKVLEPDAEPGIATLLRGAVRRLGEPVIRTAVGRAMREMGQQFVLGETVEAALRRAPSGYTLSVDMLGEAARTAADASAYLASYRRAIEVLSWQARGDDMRDNPGISIKLSALHPRYEEPQRARVMEELVPIVVDLALQAKTAGMGLNIDAEEADRLELSLDVIEAVLRHEALAGWDGFGVVVQAYGKRASGVIDWLSALADTLDRRLMVRLVKGAYWDTEIKRAQVEGLHGFPVWSRKSATDAAYLCCARKLLDAPRLYPQFATHNAHSAAAILEMGAPSDSYEFQRLHGMGEALHALLKERHGTRCRIYAPVGAHRDLLAYLVRRLLENGANSSFVNRIVDETLPPEDVVSDPIADWENEVGTPAPGVSNPADLFAPERLNSRGFDLHDPVTLGEIETARAVHARSEWQAAPLVMGDAAPFSPVPMHNPARPGERVGSVAFASPQDVASSLSEAATWSAPAADRAAVLRRAADLYETHFAELFALLAREAGKTLPDAVAELREAVDFLRYYAGFADDRPARGVIGCISPWNFPLAIFTGQIAAALAAGNGVVAKPAETTCLVAHRAVQLLHEAGVPRSALQLLPGLGRDVGAALSGDGRLAGLCFTGSTQTAQHIHRSMASDLAPAAPLIAETGGINAMIVDSTALPEQAVRDIIASAFQSAGQRCSALRLLYVQSDVAERVLTMLRGAMDELRLGDPWNTDTDIGPIITPEARDALAAYLGTARAEGRVIKQVTAPEAGAFLGPALIRVRGMADLQREVFGPVLHVATFEAGEIDAVIDAVNAAGYGLTFGLHTRIDSRVEHVAARVAVGNLYVNRNQIGAVVGSQPFGGEGLSGTGPKAGGPRYVARFYAPGSSPADEVTPDDEKVAVETVASALGAVSAVRPAAVVAETLPGPTGESNRLRHVPRGPVLCLGPGQERAARQLALAQEAGCPAIAVAPGWRGEGGLPGSVDPEDLEVIQVALVAYDGIGASARAMRVALAAKKGALTPLVTTDELAAMATCERHLCIDTTASGGNAALLAQSD